MTNMTSGVTSGTETNGTAAQAPIWNAPYVTHPLSAVMPIPGSKSLSNRFLILAALGTGEVTIHGLLRSRDTALMIAALRTLGVSIVDDPSDATSVHVTPPSNGRFNGNVHIDCGLAGTVMRFIPGLALLADGPIHIDGDEQAYARPMQPLLDGLEQLGATIEYHGRIGFLPLTITPAKVSQSTHNGDRPQASIDSHASSQFVSGLLLVASRLQNGLTLHHVGRSLPSIPHIRMTVEDVNAAGGSIVMSQPATWTVDHAEISLPTDLTVEPDLSNAAPFVGAALICGGTVSIPRWPSHSAQPGEMLPSILTAMGATCKLDDVAIDHIAPTNNHRANGMLSVVSDGTIHGLGRFDLSEAGEIAPSVAALAVLADSPTKLLGIGHLRGHETNRLAALVMEIRRIGAHADELDDGISIEPIDRSSLRGSLMHTYADHRMATFAAMIGLAVPHTTVIDIATTGKTLPDFPGMWHQLVSQAVHERH